MSKNWIDIKVTRGESILKTPNDTPIISIVEGPYPYLWIGNNSVTSAICWGHLSGKGLRRLHSLLTEALLDSRSHKKRKRTKARQPKKKQG